MKTLSDELVDFIVKESGLSENKAKAVVERAQMITGQELSSIWHKPVLDIKLVARVYEKIILPMLSKTETRENL